MPSDQKAKKQKQQLKTLMEHIESYTSRRGWSQPLGMFLHRIVIPSKDEAEYMSLREALRSSERKQRLNE